MTLTRVRAFLDFHDGNEVGVNALHFVTRNGNDPDPVIQHQLGQSSPVNSLNSDKTMFENGTTTMFAKDTKSCQVHRVKGR
jgi:hypothetical protein